MEFLLDGDIRRLMLTNNDYIDYIDIQDINQDFIYETNVNKLLIQIDKHLKYLPLLNENKENYRFS